MSEHTETEPQPVIARKVADKRHRRRHDARHPLFWLRAVVVACLMPVVFLAAAAVMIVDRDITAPSWIVDRVTAGAAEILPGTALQFGAIRLRIGRDLHPTVRLFDTSLVDADGLSVTRVPLVEGLISPRGIILQQDVLVQEVRMFGAQINLRRSTDGDLSIAFDTATGAVAGPRSLPAFVAQLDAVFAQPALVALETVAIDGVVMNFDDARAGRSWVIDGGSVGLDLTGGAVALRGDFSLLSGRPDVTTVSASYRSPRGSRTADIALNLTNGVASDLATQSPALNWLADVDAPITASLRTSLDQAGALGPLNGAFEIGAGVLRPNPNIDAVSFDGAQAYFTYDPVRDSIAFSEVSVETAWGAFAAEGDAYLREFRNGLPRALLGQLRLRDIAISPPGLFETPPRVGAAEVDLRLRLNPFTIEVGQFVLRDGDSRMTGRAKILATDAGWQVALDTAVDQVSPERFVDFWPTSMKKGSRAWFSERVQGGRLHDLFAGVRLSPGQAPHVAVGFAFEDTNVRFMRSMPVIRQARGVGNIVDHQFTINLDAGVATAPQGGPVRMDGSTFTMVDMRLRPSPAVLNLTLDSTITAALSVLNQPPFRYVDRGGLRVEIADGRAATIGQIRWPLLPEPDPDAVMFDFNATLSRVRSDVLVPGKTFVAPELSLNASRQGVAIAGVARIGDVVANGQWEQRFGDPDRPGSRVNAEVTLSPAFLDEFDIRLPDGAVSGQGTGALQLDLGLGGPPVFALTSDLVGLNVGLPAIGWSKPRDTAGNLAVVGTLGTVPRIDTLEVSGGGLQAAGRIDLDAQGDFAAAQFENVRIGDWLNAPITLRGQGDGRPPAVEISGGMLDLRQARFGAGGGGAGGPVSLSLDRLQITEGVALMDFAGSFRDDGGFRGEFSGLLNGTAPVTGTVAPRNGRSAVRVRSDDAGAVLRASGMMGSAAGGRLELTLLPAGAAGTFDGMLDVNDIRIRDAPTIAALLDAISVVGLLQQLDGQGLAFDQVSARFRLTPDAVIISEASAIGPGLGISVDGFYTLATKQIDLQGVVSPFFLVNSIGSFLTRRGEGLIGFNFNIGGSTDAPQVSVNPLSALTPGMFREIFRRPPPAVSQ
ncbi:MAG: AsmA-like C-terminal region-containing protein [Pseudomonadota bacterium]